MEKAVISIPKIQKQDFEGIKWVLKAKDKTESRWHMQLLHTFGRHVWATDGHRLHAYKLFAVEIPKGSYKVTVSKDEILLLQEPEAEAPDWKNVFPKHVKVKAKADTGHEISYTYTNLVRVMDSTETVNLKYVEEMTQDNFGRFRYFGEGRPIWFRNGRKTGLVMPMRF